MRIVSSMAGNFVINCMLFKASVLTPNFGVYYVAEAYALDQALGQLRSKVKKLGNLTYVFSLEENTALSQFIVDLETQPTLKHSLDKKT